MRLIDADAFIEYLGLDDKNAREENIGEIVTLEDFDRQLTAYDINKKCEEIDKLRMMYFLTIANADDEKLDYAYEKVSEALDEVIKIIKTIKNGEI